MDLVAKLEAKDNLSKSLDNVKKKINEVGGSSSKLNQIQEKFERIESSTAPLKRKVRDIQKAMEDLSVSGLKTSKEGQQMWDDLAKKAQQYNKELKAIQDSTKGVGDISQNTGKGGFDIKGIGGDLANKAGLGGVTSSLGSLAAMANPATIAVAAVGTTMVAAGKAAADFETHLDSLQSLTGLSDEAMKSISDGAIDMSKNFKASAGDIVDAMKLIGSQAPELLTNKDALMMVTEAANTLAEAAQIDVVDAAKAITGTMNQMGASASEAKDIINVFAAASQQGAGDVAYLNKAFEKSGTAAASAGMSYTELAAAVEAIAPKFSSADVAGSQLSSTLLKLSMSGKSDFMPSVVGMQTALENLAKAEMTDSEMKALVGESNVTMLKSLIQAKDAYAGYTQSLANTNTAYEQMAINNDNFAGKIDKLKNTWDAFLITLGQSAIIDGIADNIMKVMEALGEVINVLSDVVNAFGDFGDGSTENVNIAMIQLDLLISVIKGVGEVLQVIIKVAAKVFNYLTDKAQEAADWIGEKWNKLKEDLGDIAFVNVLISAFNKVMDAAANAINTIKKLWNKLKEFLGMKTDAVVDIKTTHTDEVKTENKGDNTNSNTGGKSTSKTGKTKGKTTKTEKKPLQEKDDNNSLKFAQDMLRQLESQRLEIPIDKTKTLADNQAKIDKWKKEVEARKATLATEIKIKDDGSIAYAQEQIKALEKENVNIKVNAENDLTIDAEKTIAENNSKIENWKKELEKRKVTIVADTKFSEGSIEYAKDMLAKSKKALETIDVTIISDEDLAKAKAQVEKWEKEVESREITMGVKVKKSEASITAPSKNETFETGSIDDLRESLSNARSMIQQIKSDYADGLIDSTAAREQIDELNAKLAELGLKPIELTVENDGSILTAAEELERVQEQTQMVIDSVGSIGDSFSTIGSAIGGTTGALMQFTGQTLSSITQMLPQIAALIGGNFAQAMSAGTASAAALPFPANLAAIASIVAGIASIAVQAKSMKSNFAEGGIVGGSSFHGDKILAGLNAGEMVLNKRQQSNLFKVLDGSVNNSQMGGNVEFKISGSTLKGVLRNYDSKMNKLGN